MSRVIATPAGNRVKRSLVHASDLVAYHSR